MAAAMLISGCSGGNSKTTAPGAGNSENASGKEIQMTFPTYLAGENVGAVFFLPEVERFNQKYAGKYKIVIEEVPQAQYAEKNQAVGPAE